MKLPVICPKRQLSSNVAFKSVINEYYARDISKKIRSSKELYKQQGKAIGGRPPYGYMPDPADKTHYVINPETAPVVKRIFAMAADGDGAYIIAKTLLEEGVWSPQDYRSGEYTGAEWNVAYIYRMSHRFCERIARVAKFGFPPG